MPDAPYSTLLCLIPDNSTHHGAELDDIKKSYHDCRNYCNIQLYHDK